MRRKSVTKKELDLIMFPIKEARQTITHLEEFLSAVAIDDPPTCSSKQVNLLISAIRLCRERLNTARHRIDLSFNKEAHLKSEKRWRSILKRKETEC